MGRLALVLTVLAACGGDHGPSGPPDVYFDLGADTGSADTFWSMPFPSDLRLTGDGNLDLTGFPNQRDVPLVTDLLRDASEHAGAPLMPVSYIRFGAAVPTRRHTDVIPAGADQDVFLVDIDAASPEQETMVPLVAEDLVQDDFSPPTLVAIAPRPGIVLRAHTSYALVLRRSFAPDAAPPDDWVALEDGTFADAHATDVYAPLWPVLDDLGVAKDDVLVASVFTTGDETQRLYDRSEAVRAGYDAVISDLAIDPVDGASHDGYCELVGTVTFPQFQQGTAPWDDGMGHIVYDGSGAPVMQSMITVPLVITIPFGQMPANGWPLYQFFHGSGGLSSQVVDRGPVLAPGGAWTVGEGPSFVVAKQGIAAASSALPVNPERLPGATDYEYLNISNLSALPFTFQEGVFEQRLLLDALLDLRIPAATLAGCSQVTLPGGATEHRFDPAKLVAGGQSMGGMYTNLVASVEPRYGALIPTGAGGFWNLMILETALVPGARQLLSAAFATDDNRFNFMHPALDLLAIGWEVAEPVMSMSRIERRPLDEPGFAPRNVYEVVGSEDTYFSNSVYDAAALSYGHQEAGDIVWPTMQDALAVDGLDGILSYPISNNRGATTGVVVQYANDGILSGHDVFQQLPAVKHQYACFLATYLATGVATVVGPGAIDDPCN